MPYERMVLVHLTLAGLGWLTLLILAVGRVLAPMLALAPAPERRGRPWLELTFTAALWPLLAGLAAGLDWLVLAAGAAATLVLARFAVQLVGVGRRQRLGTFEGPLAHLLAGAAFLTETVGVGFAGVVGALDGRRAAAAFATLLLVGWAAGVVVGHAGKLLALSA